MRFYLDENISPSVAVIARSRWLDVISTHECGRNGLPDTEQLELAARDGRCLVTRDRRDFIAATLQFLDEGRPHTGVLLISEALPNDDFAGIAAALVAFAQGHSSDTLEYAMNFLARAPAE